MIASNKRCTGDSGRLWPIGTGLQMLGFALMAGGMLALGAFTAPTVFGQFSREMAAPVMATIFRRYDIVLLLSLGLVWLGEMLRWMVRRFPLSSFKCPVLALRGLLLLALTGGMLYSTLFLNADIERMNRSGVHRSYLTAEGRRFESVHKLSENLYKVDLLMVVVLILLTPFLSPVSRAELTAECSTTVKETDSPHV